VRDNDFYRRWDAVSRDRERFGAWLDELRSTVTGPAEPLTGATTGDAR
jgi:glutaconate CoA-transferase subunit A